MAREKTAAFKRSVEFFDGDLNRQKISVTGTAPVATTVNEAISLLGEDALE